MLSKRIVAIASEKAFVRKLASGLMAAGGTVETAASLDDLAKGEIAADLVALHVPPGATGLVAQVAARMRKDAGLIAIVDTSNLEQIVEVMKSGRVASVLVADNLAPATLSATATRLLWGDVFGLEKTVPWGVKVYSALVGDYQEKSVVIGAVSDFATAMGVRRKYRESIEQVLDELLMNALYDAPVDSAGKQMFADVPTKTRISLRMEQKAIVQYACEGDLFAMSVRDGFGALQGDTVVKYLDKCLHAEQQIDRKAGGAGLGLYIIANAATQFVINIMPGVATEVTCTFDLTAAKVQLKHFGVFYERIDSAGRLATAGPTRMVPSGRATSQMGLAVAAPSVAAGGRGLTWLLTGAIVLMLALIGVVGYDRFMKKSGGLTVVTDPPGASIELDGKAQGTATASGLVLDELPLERTYKLTARLEGYEPAELIAEPSEQNRPVQVKLTPRRSVVMIESDPTGATVLVDGKERGVTPVSIDDLPAGSEQQITLKKTGYSDLVRKVKVPAPGRDTQKEWSLEMSPDFASVRFQTEPPGAQIWQNGELLAGVTTPVAEHIIQAKKEYQFVFRAKGFQPLPVPVTLPPGTRDQVVGGKLTPGASLSVKVNLEDVLVSVVGVPACTGKIAPLVDCPLARGKYRVELRSDKPPLLREDLNVTIGDEDVSKTVALGVVEAAPDFVVQVPGGRKSGRRVALPAGKQNVTLVGKDGTQHKVLVVVKEGALVKAAPP